MHQPPLRRLDRGGALGCRVLAFPYAGGGGHIYQPLAASFADAEWWAAEYPGHLTRLGEPLVPDLVPLADTFLDDVAALLDRPTVLLGYSMGALVAFEVAQRLRARAELRGLVVCAARAPTRPFVTQERVAEMDDARFLQELTRREGAPAGLLEHPELLELALPVLRADFVACERYRCQSTTPLPLPIVALHGSRDLDVRDDDVAAWGALSERPFERVVLEGSHFFLHEPAAQLEATLSSVLRALFATSGDASYTSRAGTFGSRSS